MVAMRKSEPARRRRSQEGLQKYDISNERTSFDAGVSGVMNLKAIFLLLVLISLSLIGLKTIGLAALFSIMALVFLIMAISFTMNNRYFDSHILFYSSPAYFHIVPKRGLTAEQPADFQALVRTHMPQGKLK
jgi:hypothetical protein